MIKLVGISGKKHSGKDTMAQAFITTLSDIKVIRMAFADPLKDEVCKACGVTREFLEANKSLFRPILQWWGTEFRRKLFGENYWIDRTFERIAVSVADVVLITDMRFKNEMAAVEKWPAGVTIRIERIGQDVKDPHPSEVDLDDATFDYKLSNVSDLSTFEHDCARFANRVLTQRIGLSMRGEPE